MNSSSNKPRANNLNIKNKNQNLNRRNFNNNRKFKRNNNRRFNNRRNFNRNKNRNNQNVIKVNRPKNIIQRNINKNNKNSVIKGKDLIISTNNQLVNQTSGIYAIIPINPLYWQGTRIKNMALQYQYFTPKNLSIEYVPTVSKLQQGTVTIGCITKQIINQSTIQQTLVSSTSGETFSCSEYFNKTIALNSLLQQKKLLLSSDISKESVPFYIVILLNNVILNNELIAPGSIYFNYNIHFYNPITETLNYKTENSIKIRDIDFYQQNITCILLEENNSYGVGTQVDVEMKNQVPIYKYNNTEIELDFEKYVTVFYSNVPGFNQANKQEFDLSEYSYSTSLISISLLNGERLIVVDTNTSKFSIFYKISASSGISVREGLYYKVANSDALVIEYLQGINFVLDVFNYESGIIELTGQMIVDVEFENEHL